MLGGCKINAERSKTWEDVYVHHEGHNVGGNKKLVSGTFPLKGTVSVISSDPPCKVDNARYKTIPSKP